MFILEVSLIPASKKLWRSIFSIQENSFERVQPWSRVDVGSTTEEAGDGAWRCHLHSLSLPPSLNFFSLLSHHLYAYLVSPSALKWSHDCTPSRGCYHKSLRFTWLDNSQVEGEYFLKESMFGHFSLPRLCLFHSFRYISWKVCNFNSAECHIFNHVEIGQSLKCKDLNI